MEVAECPECDTEIEFRDGPEALERIRCSNCRTELIVTRVSPTRLDWAFRPPLHDDTHIDQDADSIS